MKLGVSQRTLRSKGELNRIRHEGDIPAVLYSKGGKSEDMTVSGSDFGAAIRAIPQGHLPTTVFEIEVGGKKQRAIVKEVQYHKTTYKPLHLDLYLLNDKEEISVNVPLECSGVEVCPGIKLGGFLRRIKRHVRVRCLPKAMPSEFVVDISKVGLKQSKRVSDITFPKGVKPLVSEKEVVVVVGK
ncbi:MAG: 50S ribosomal protein L25 [Simkaniaceae bacterium]|nr:50S ribosomal protein L25 [Simkaniaceae bacterium]